MLAKQQVDVTGLDEELDALEAEVVQEDIDTLPSAPTVRLSHAVWVDTLSLQPLWSVSSIALSLC